MHRFPAVFLLCLMFSGAARSQDLAVASHSGIETGSDAGLVSKVEMKADDAAPEATAIREGLPSRPEPIALVQPGVTPSTPIPDGMVWDWRHGEWHAERINSCFWCGTPSTFRQAAIEPKYDLMFAGATVLTIADIEVFQAVCHAGCREADPLFGNGSRGIQYGIRVPILVGEFFGNAYLRKGNKKYHIGGLRGWWIPPAIMQVVNGAAILSNLARRPN